MIGARTGIISEYAFAIKASEHLMALSVRIKHDLVCGMQFCTSTGGLTPWYGDGVGGNR
jgi:hypothetical protein